MKKKSGHGIAIIVCIVGIGIMLWSILTATNEETDASSQHNLIGLIAGVISILALLYLFPLLYRSTKRWVRHEPKMIFLKTSHDSWFGTRFPPE